MKIRHFITKKEALIEKQIVVSKEKEKEKRQKQNKKSHFKIKS
jgi:hypothetical protein